MPVGKSTDTMKDDELGRTLTFIKRMFPEFTGVIDPTFSRDCVFREIASDYHECIMQEKAFQEGGHASDPYAETIKELKEEINAYLTGLETGRPDMEVKKED